MNPPPSTYYAVLLALVLGVGCGEGKQSTNTSQSSNTPEKSAKKKAEKETPTSTSWVSDPSDPNNVKIEAAIRKAAKKPTGELTKVNLEKVTWLSLSYNQLTDVTALKELTQLTRLGLGRNPDLTKSQIAELQKALPKCKITHNLSK